MNLPDADAARLAQEAAVRFKRSALIAQEAARFATMAKKIGSKTRPAIRLLAESERLQTEADMVKAEAEQFLAQSHELLPAAEIIGSPLPSSQSSASDANVVDVEPMAAAPKPAAARMMVPLPKPPVATEKWGAGITPTPEVFRQSTEPPRPAAAPAKPAAEISTPVSEAAKPAPPKVEAPSPVLREVNRFHERLSEKPKPAAPAAKPAFFKRIFSFGKSAAPAARPAPAITRSAASTAKPLTETPAPRPETVRPAAPAFEAPKAAAPPVAALVPVAPRVEKTPPPSAPPNPFVTCHCPHCDQGVEFDATELTAENCLIPCPNCGEEMKLLAP